MHGRQKAQRGQDGIVSDSSKIGDAVDMARRTIKTVRAELKKAYSDKRRAERQIEAMTAFLRSISAELPRSEWATVNGMSRHSHAKQPPSITVPDYGPITDRGTPRQRQWSVLLPAIEQAIATMDEVTSPAVYQYLKDINYEFAAPTKNRAISSIAAALRKKRDQGTLEVLRPGLGSTAVVFRKVKQAGKTMKAANSGTR